MSQLVCTSKHDTVERVAGAPLRRSVKLPPSSPKTSLAGLRREIRSHGLRSTAPRDRHVLPLQVKLNCDIDAGHGDAGRAEAGEKAICGQRTARTKRLMGPSGSFHASVTAAAYSLRRAEVPFDPMQVSDVASFLARAERVIGRS